MIGDNRIIYKNRSKENYLKLQKNFDNLSIIKEFFNQYLSFESKEEFESLLSSKNYIHIYNTFFLIKNQKELIDIYSYINQTIVNLINQKLKTSEESKDNIEYIKQVINYINIIEKKIKNLKNLLITCTSRFNSELIKSMNDNLNIFSVFSKTKDALIQFIENSKKIILDKFAKERKENQELHLSIYQFFNIIKYLLNHKEIESFTEKMYNIIIKESKYDDIYEDISKKLSEKLSEGNVIKSDYINIYFNSIYNEIEKDYAIFLKIFGEKEANKYKEKIIKIYIFEKLINDIFKNEKLLKVIISEKNYDILKIIESKTRHSLKLTKEFINSLFDVLLNEFLNKVSPPKPNDIKKGVEYIEQIILKIIELNSIFKEVFNQNRKVQLKFHETILKLISSKNFEALEYFISIYVNENLYKENKRNNYILNKAFIQLLSNTNNKETFFNYHKKYIIKRISNNIFNLDIELAFHDFLKRNIENRFMSKVNRIFKDIHESNFINDAHSKNYFYLFSFDTLDNQYDLLQIIDLEKQNYEVLNPFKAQMNNYNQIYPKRKITLSQIFSSLEIVFLNKYNLVMNYIQWYIMQIILNQKNDKYSITYEKLCSLIPFKAENKIFLKVYINSLIELQLLIKQSNNIIENDFNSNDILQLNLNFKSDKNNIICFIKPNTKIRTIIKNMNKTESEQKENEKEDYIKNYKSNAVKDNAGKIIDCVIMQILKALPSGENMIEKDLIINLLKHKIVNDLQLRKYNAIDTLYLKQRLDNLVSLDYIKRNIDSNTNVISYSYC